MFCHTLRLGPQIAVSEMGWRELSDAQRAAATRLGYDEQLWADDTAPEEKERPCDRDWADLSETEQAAVRLLGWEGEAVRDTPPLRLAAAAVASLRAACTCAAR